MEAGYDALAERYVQWSSRVQGDPRDRFIEELAAHLEDGACVVDLGCGAGVPSTKRLAERFDVVGVDVSAEQLRLARANVPAATFVHADLVRVDFPPDSLDAVTAFYAITHLPRTEHGPLFERINRWLRPGGLFLASLSHGDSADGVEEWLGVPMFFGGFDAETNRRLVREAGLAILRDENVTMTEPDYGDVTFLWLLTQKSTG